MPAGSGFHLSSFLEFSSLLPTPPSSSFRVSAEFLLSDDFRFYTGVTAVLVDTCLRHIPVPAPLVRVPLPFLRVPVLSAGENTSNLATRN